MAEKEISFNNRLIIGSKEMVCFPDQHPRQVVARIDSGAKSTSAHCDKIWTEKIGGKTILCCYFLKRSKKVTRFSEFKRRRVRSSNGTLQTRYVVKLRIRLASVTKESDVTLTDRSTMNYSVLLGRRFLKDDFLIDVSGSYIQTKSRSKEKVKSVNSPKKATQDIL